MDRALLKPICDLAFAFHTEEGSSLGLPDFPVENIEKVARILNACGEGHRSLNPTKLMFKIFPHSLVLKEEEANAKFYADLLQKFKMPPLTLGEEKYELDEVIDAQERGMKVVKFKANGKNVEIKVQGGEKAWSESEAKAEGFVMNAQHSSALVDMMLNHSSGHDFALVGAQGSGKTALIRQFAYQLNYDILSMHLFK